MTWIGVITGSRREAACLVPVPAGRVKVECSGGRPARARALAASLADEGCEALLSFGLAGGLDPSLKPGGIVVASTVIAPDGTKVPTDAGLTDRCATALEAAGIAFRIGAIAGLDDLVRLSETKDALHRGTGALCVDMESHEVMRIAAANGIPYFVVRAVADAAGDEIPLAAASALAPSGSIAPLSLIWALVRRPADLSGLAMLARRSASGFAALRRVAAAAGAAGSF